MADHPNRRDLEKGIETDLGDRLDYQGYLGLDRVLDAQFPLSDPPHHDEMLFIIQHQTAELWFKLIIHELKAAIAHLASDEAAPSLKILARVKMVQQQLFDQWAVLETLTPSEYMQFRDVLGSASGFQSFQYRCVEFLLGNKNRDLTRVFAHQPRAMAELEQVLEAPSVYDEFLRYLARRGLAVPAECIERDFAEPHEFSSDLVDVLVEIYRDTGRWWTEYALCERLVDVEESFQLWRYRHLKSVERIIGHKTGTGGSSGVGFLEKALSLRFFPELMEVRTRL
ncbi:MAG TPA: tryptophan 2,3-dioxygenase family protein [Wenzhouxiangellaceae bacterium]|nr:tryptophan 2,3-dioxygenase family protein [Wenzhouxiangellaceae bacterium]HKL52650.1 tryptophan 2,3-dioxygenase family protein [Wenzhouxiangellaceae bacterium]